MKTIKEIDAKIPALCIDTAGEIIQMDKDDYHRTFFSSILGELMNAKVKEDDLSILIEDLVKKYNQVIYIGCSEGDRKYSGGFMFINDIKHLTNEQINSLIEAYSAIASNYDVDIQKIDSKDDNISIGEVYEEFLARESKGKLR